MTLPTSSDSLAVALASFDVAIASRLMRGIEDDDVASAARLHGLPSLSKAAHIIGITGAGGVGKSTLLSKLVGQWRAQELCVGVLAIDPSSSLTGGALLGDRVRMAEHASDSGVFIRSVGSRGGSGGIATTTAQLIDVLQHMGCDVIAVETLGAGQDELAVADLVDTTVLVTMPRAGDDVQAMKAGLLERADVIVLNKSELVGAGAAVADLQVVARWSSGHSKAAVAVLQTSAVNGAGVVELAAHLRRLQASPKRPTLRFSALAAIETQLQARVRGQIGAWLRDSPQGQSLCERVSAGEETADAAAAAAWAAVLSDANIESA